MSHYPQHAIDTQRKQCLGTTYAKLHITKQGVKRLVVFAAVRLWGTGKYWQQELLQLTYQD